MIATTESEITYDGNGDEAVAYPIPFPFLAAADIKLLIDDEAAEYGTDYTVTPTLNAIGRITGGSLYTVEAQPDTATLSIYRDTPQEQPTNFVLGGGVDPETVELALDRLTMIAQEAFRKIDLGY